MESRIVFEGKTRDGESYVIRYPRMDDVRAMMDFINKLSQERTYIRFQGEVISLEQEREFLQGQIDKIGKKLAVHLMVVLGDKIIGGSAINMEDKTESHVGVFGITLAHDYRGQGIGKKLMEMVIATGIENLVQLKIITLGVFGDNLRAQEMYRSFGFVEYGRLPEGVFRQGSYADRVLMYKKVK